MFFFHGVSKENSDDRILSCAHEFARRVGKNIPRDIRVLRNDAGKPSLTSGNIHFSVSHSGDIWACAVGDAPLGLDIQQHVSCNMRGVAKRFFHPDEYAHLEGNGYRDFFCVWAAKESYVKYTGSGIDDDFNAFCVVKNGELRQRVDHATLTPIGLLQNGSGYICSAHPAKVVIVCE